MAVARYSRFRVSPDDVGELLSRRAALIDAVRARFTGLSRVALSRIDEESWLDMWRWDSADEMQAALSAAGTIPEAGPAFAVAREFSAEVADIVDER